MKHIDIFTDPVDKIHYEGRAEIVNIMGEHYGHTGRMIKALVRFLDRPDCLHTRYIFIRGQYK